MTTATENQYQSALVARAVKDQAFRSRLLDSPQTTIEQALGVKLPENVEVKVLEEKPNTIYIVLPPPLAAPTRASTDLGLDEVAGFAMANTHTGCGNCSVTAPQTSRPCGCR